MKDFNKKQMAEYKKLKTIQEKAAYLLQFDITARLNMNGLDLVNQAFIGKVGLPITGDSDEEVISKARAWLEEKAAA